MQYVKYNTLLEKFKTQELCDKYRKSIDEKDRVYWKDKKGYLLHTQSYEKGTVSIYLCDWFQYEQSGYPEDKHFYTFAIVLHTEGEDDETVMYPDICKTLLFYRVLHNMLEKKERL